MDRLPERQKTAMLLRYAEEMTQKEAAEVLGIGEKALESLLSRGKAQLKLWLKK
jgi:RNA polymerase sigma-70 factor (ECF subfamily)